MTHAQVARGRVVGGRYRIEGTIGRGAVGEVYEARHLLLDVPVAVKWVPGAFEDEELKGRAIVEARTAALLTSPHVARTLDFGFEDGAAFITMELLRGETLEQRLARRRRLSPRETFDVLRDVARGLAEAHQNGILHRDLKPQNIFLCAPDGGREIAKILDFGVALFAQVQRRFTRAGLTIGTPAYMSPEQATAFREVDARSDFWQLAIIAFECLTGTLPYEDADDLGGLVAQMPLVGAAAHDHPDLPDGFAPWLARATSLNPDERFPDAKSFINGLAEALELDDESPTHTDTGSERRTARGALVALGVAIALLAATLAVIVAYLVTKDRAVTAEAPATVTEAPPPEPGHVELGLSTVSADGLQGAPGTAPSASAAHTPAGATASASAGPRAPRDQRKAQPQGDPWGLDSNAY